MITENEILKNRDEEYPPTNLLRDNLHWLLTSMNVVRHFYNKPLIVTSGYRPGRYNTEAKGAPNSAHLTCEACDFADPKAEFAKWCGQNLDLLRTLKLRMENPKKTPGWVHLDTRGDGKVVVFEP